MRGCGTACARAWVGTYIVRGLGLILGIWEASPTPFPLNNTMRCVAATEIGIRDPLPQDYLGKAVCVALIFVVFMQVDFLIQNSFGLDREHFANVVNCRLYSIWGVRIWLIFEI
jgi:hypothetical protein